ncbi:LytTR family transcriptional regulator [Mucilaginibacter sp. ZT4R22]|uniref:LytTR family transcriptional regulator n=1 Tax=Mucilaginibacter pankratovii TaxID=2772110 RepID=A0ABR7WKR6_9SPHI|nr:LytTR family DNA-binding domain-containing protein [Mucilaginibacter pankratovii]MBD1362921.1 LytTR family transcriptional regulator [Mucilaginibacter pankratovii]
MKEAIVYMQDIIVDLLILDKNTLGPDDLEMKKSIPPGTLIICTGTLNSYCEHARLKKLLSFPAKFQRMFYQKCSTQDSAVASVDESEGLLMIDLAGEDFFYARKNNTHEKIFFKDITYIEASENLAVLHLEEQRLITNLSINSIQTFLPSKFQRINLSLIVNIDHTILFDHQTLFVGNEKIRIKGTASPVCEPSTAGIPVCKSSGRACQNLSCPANRISA